MAELIGYTQCNRRGCKQAAEFKKDKRGKFFMNCPTHGRDPGSTNDAQTELAALLETGAVFESVADFETGQEVQTVASLKKALEAAGHEVTTSQDVIDEILEDSETEPETEPEKAKGKAAGVIALLVGLIATGGYLWTQKNKQPTR